MSPYPEKFRKSLSCFTGDIIHFVCLGVLPHICYQKSASSGPHIDQSNLICLLCLFTILTHQWVPWAPQLGTDFPVAHWKREKVGYGEDVYSDAQCLPAFCKVVEGKEISQKFWILSICQLSLFSPSLGVTVDTAKMFELMLGEKTYLRHCLGLPMQELLSVHKLSLVFHIFLKEVG